MSAFEFDEEKSQANLQKHGIDFHRAQQLWKDNELLEVQARSDDEPRCLVVGRIDEQHWSAIVTYRGEKIRIISVRRSRKSEVTMYEG
ncbi:BrnT family toxin [Spiribacter aquaticus]|uniref:BrnT family toxin n=1 Tax=Spiribacter aquaticus TaxID=1935996 RepID=A0A557RKJ1_9GAMM|nr:MULTISPECIES: BrnT family toxin [Spiribacter]KAF0279800.1 toxin [Spiribacter roseus]TVO65679.1 BrnT family toxin [Spiribacter aquaticus]